MDVRWVTAFVDRPDDHFEPTMEFWTKVTSSVLSPWRGDADEFATLLPTDGGDAHLRVQRTTTGHASSHIDLHVPHVRRGIEACTGHGARVVTDRGTYAVLASPGGMAFCVVAHRDEQTRQRPAVIGASGTATLVDQVSIDVDPDMFEAETVFWSSITGWPPLDARAPEFVPLQRPASIPLRAILQRRARRSGPTTCHLDIACENVPAAVADHQSLGAVVISTHRYWTVMNDPAGGAYCLTSRLPVTGRLPAGG